MRSAGEGAIAAARSPAGLAIRPPGPNGILGVALLSIFPAWILGVEQIVPPALLIAGCALLALVGRLRVPPEAWALAVFVAWTLVPALRLGDSASRLLYLRGEFNLVAGLAALLLAANAELDEAGRSRLAARLSQAAVLLAVLAGGFVIGLVPASFEVPYPGIYPARFQESSFVSEELLVRDVGAEVEAGELAVPRISGVFLHRGGMGSALLPLLTLVWFLWTTLPRRKRRWSYLGLVAAMALVPLSGNRTAIALVLAVAAVPVARWLAARVGRPATLVLAALVAGLTAVAVLVPIGGRSVVEQAFLDYRPESAVSRAATYEASLASLGERPLLGWGVQEMQRSAGDTHLRLGTHSELLNVAYRFGALGLAAYLAVGCILVRGVALRWLAARRSGADRVAAWTIFAAGLAAMCVNALLHGLQWDVNIYWLHWCVPGIVYAWARHEAGGVAAAVR